MTRVVNQRRYSEAFKRQVLDEIRVGKWSTPYASVRASLRPAAANSSSTRPSKEAMAGGVEG